MSIKAVKKSKTVKKPMNKNVVKASRPTNSEPSRKRRLSDREFRKLERSVYREVIEFEEMMSAVLIRHAWASLLKAAVKNHPDSLTDEQKSKLEHVIKAYDTVCEGDAIFLTLKAFSEESCRRRREFALEDESRDGKESGNRLHMGKACSKPVKRDVSHPKTRARK